MKSMLLNDLVNIKSKDIKANKEKKIFALKIIPKFTRLAASFGISGSFIKPNQKFEKKNAVEKPNKIRIQKVHKYKKFLF